MGEKSFLEIYAEAKRQPTAARLVIERVSKCTGLSRGSIQNWISNKAKPSIPVQILLEREFNTPREILFPEESENK